METQTSPALLLGRYRTIELRDTGGFGSVLVCWDVRLQRRVAVKCLPLDAEGDAASVVDEALAEAQQREIRAQEELRQAEADVARAEAALAVAQAQRCIRCTEGHAAERPLILSEASRATGSVESVMGDSVRGRVRAMGEQFLLSDREVDVLALYAMGYTQKKVAEELFITPATAHTHIKRIYAKCGMHSRQEILEYLASWGS